MPSLTPVSEGTETLTAVEENRSRPATYPSARTFPSATTYPSQGNPNVLTLTVLQEA